MIRRLTLLAVGLLVVLPLRAARNLNGTTSYLIHGAAPLNTEPITIACWFRATGTGVGNVVTIGNGSGSAIYYTLRAQGSVTPHTIRALALTGNSPASVQAETTTGYTVGQWHHAAVVFAWNDSRAAYLDGGGKGTNTTGRASFTSTRDRLLIGAGLNSGSPFNFFAGDVAEVGIWSAALTDAEILALARGVPTILVRPQSLVWWQPLDRSVAELRSGAAITDTATSVAPHPRIYRAGE